MKKRSLRESLAKYVVDTGVLIEYIIETSPYRDVIDKLFGDALNKIVELYI